MVDNVQSAIIQRLLASSGVTDLVSTNIYADIVPDGTPHPFIMVEQQPSEERYARGAADSGSMHARYTFANLRAYVYASDYDENNDLVGGGKSGCVEVVQAVEDALDGYSGTLQGINIGVIKTSEGYANHDVEIKQYRQVVSIRVSCNY